MLERSYFKSHKDGNVKWWGESNLSTLLVQCLLQSLLEKRKQVVQTEPPFEANEPLYFQDTVWEGKEGFYQILCVGN